MRSKFTPIIFSLAIVFLTTPSVAKVQDPHQALQKFVDKITFAHLPRPAMSCQALLAAANEFRVSSEPVQRELTKVATEGFREFFDRISLPDLPPIIEPHVMLV